MESGAHVQFSEPTGTQWQCYRSAQLEPKQVGCDSHELQNIQVL